MTNRGRVVKALQHASKTGRTVAEIVALDPANHLTIEKAETALDQLARHALVQEVSEGRYLLADR